MKAFLLSLLLIASIVSGFAVTTNGVLYVDQSVECRLIAQDGRSATNQLVQGKTYLTVNDGILEFNGTNKTTYYLSGGILVEASAQSAFSIDMFDQDVENLDDHPRLAKFGPNNISITFNRGEFNVVYHNPVEGSSLTVNTPFAAYQVEKGSYFFKVSEKSAIAFVGEGTMQIHGDKQKVDKPQKGNLSVVVPFPDSELDDKFVTSIKTLKPEEIERYTAPLQSTIQKTNDVRFIVIVGRVIGVWMR